VALGLAIWSVEIPTHLTVAETLPSYRVCLVSLLVPRQVPLLETPFRRKILPPSSRLNYTLFKIRTLPIIPIHYRFLNIFRGGIFLKCLFCVITEIKTHCRIVTWPIRLIRRSSNVARQAAVNSESNSSGLRRAHLSETSFQLIMADKTTNIWGSASAMFTLVI